MIEIIILGAPLYFSLGAPFLLAMMAAQKAGSYLEVPLTLSQRSSKALKLLRKAQQCFGHYSGHA